MKDDEITDEELLQLLIECDAESFDQGNEIRKRQFDVPSRAMRRLGYTSFIGMGPGAPPILARIQAAFGALYRTEDLAIGGHIGVFMFRDVFARIAIPLAFGTVAIQPVDFLDLPALQRRVLSQDAESLLAFHDQFADVFDLEYGLSDLKAEYAGIELVRRFLHLSRLHLHSAAAVLTGGYDYRGAVQSSLLGTELALKAAAATDCRSSRSNNGSTTIR